MAYTYDDLIALALKHLPAFKFSKGPNGEDEVFYPVDVEGWLAHQAAQPEIAEYGRGTALYRWRAAIPLIGGTGNDAWLGYPAEIAPGSITNDSAAATGIGHARLQQRPPLVPTNTDPAAERSKGDWYLDFGGWSDAGDRSFGQLKYPWTTYESMFSGLQLPLGQPIAEPDGISEDITTPPSFTPDANSLHTYVEFAKVGDLMNQLLTVKLTDEQETAMAGFRDKWQGKSDELAERFALTYHLFYPVYVPPDAKLMEGQWEAVSLFLEDRGGANFQVHHASYTQGWENRGEGPGLFPKQFANCQDLYDVEWGEDAEHPVVYVAWGSHANYFTPRTGEESRFSWDGAISGGIIAAPIFGVGVLLIIAGVVIAVIGALCIAGTIDIAWPCWLVVAIGIALVVVGFLLVAASIAVFAAIAAGSSTETLPGDVTPRDDAHGGDGAAAITGAGTPDSPAPTAAGRAVFTIHPVTPDDIAKDPRSTKPAWWEYSGRWGVCVSDVEAQSDPPSWSNGTWRRRPDGHTPTHRNIEALLDRLHEQADRQTDDGAVYA